MAEIRDQLILDIDQALRSVDDLGDSIKKATNVELDVGADQLKIASTAAQDLRVELSKAALEAFNTGTPAREVAEALEIGRRESIDFATALGRVQTSAKEAADELAETERAVRRAADEADRLALETARAGVESGKTEANFAELARTLGVSEDEARRLSGEILDAASSAARLDREAEEVARALGLSESQARQFVQELSKGPRQLQQIDDRVGRVNQGFSRMRGLIIGAVAAFGVRGLVNAAGSAIDSFNSLNESVNAVNVTFGEGADIIFEFGERSARSAGLARGAFQQAVVPIGALLQNFGFDARQSASAAVELTQRAADLASVFNTDVNDALDAIGSALRGETEPIRRYGVDVSQAAVAAQALSTGLVDNIGDLEGATLATGRLNEILRQTDRVMGDFARTIEDPANAVRALAGEFEDAKAGIGEALIPAFQELLAQAPDLIDALEDIGPAIGGIALAAVEAAPGIVAFIDFVLEQVDRLTIGLQLSDVRDDLNEALGGGADAGNDLIEVLRILAVTNADEQFNALFVSSAKVEEEFSKIERTVKDLDEALDSGTPKLDALAVALGEAGRESVVTESLLRVLQTRVGLADTEFASFLTQFLDSSQAIGFTAEEIQVINNLLAIFTFESGGAEAEWRRFQSALQRSEGLGQLPPIVDDGITSLRELQIVADEAGVSIGEAFGSDLFPEGTTFTGLAELEVELEGFRDRMNAVGREIDPLQGAVDNLEISKEEFIDNVTAQFEQDAEFQAAITRLILSGQPALAAAIEELGAGALPLVREFLADPIAAEDLDQMFDPAANAIVTGLDNAIRQEFIAGGFSALGEDLISELNAAFINANFEKLSEDQVKNIAAGVESPASISFMGQAGRATAEQYAGGLADFINENADQVGFDIVRDLAAGVTSQEAVEQAIAAARTVAEKFNEALAANVRFDFDFDLPTPTFTPTQQPSTSAGPNEGLPSGSFGVQINQEINTTPERESTDTARATQLAGATAHNIRGVSG